MPTRLPAIKKTKPTLKEIRESLNPFQQELLEEIWQHFQPKGEWPIVRKLFSTHGTQKVRDALSNLKGKGNVSWEETGPKGWTICHLSLLGVLLTKDGESFYSLIERFLQFQRDLFKKEPETTYVTCGQIKLSLKESQLLGQLLYLGQQGGSPVPNESWNVNAMKEAEFFPPTGSLSAQVDEWIFRYYRPDAQVFLDQRAAQQFPFTIPTLLPEDESGSYIQPPANATYWPNTAFIMMWMDKSRPDLDDVANAISEVCRQFGIKAVRADKVQHQEKITDIILEHIKQSQFLIADLTGERPNVYYEVGYAHSLGKNPILFRKVPTQLHFDLAGYNVPIYENITSLKELLRNRFEALLGKKPKTTKKQRTIL